MKKPRRVVYVDDYIGPPAPFTGPDGKEAKLILVKLKPRNFGCGATFLSLSRSINWSNEDD